MVITLTIFNLWHDSVAEGQQSEELLAVFVLRVKSIREVGVVELEGHFVVGVVRQVHWSHVLETVIK